MTVTASIVLPAAAQSEQRSALSLSIQSPHLPAARLGHQDVSGVRSVVLQ